MPKISAYSKEAVGTVGLIFDRPAIHLADPGVAIRLGSALIEALKDFDPLPDQLRNNLNVREPLATSIELQLSNFQHVVRVFPDRLEVRSVRGDAKSRELISQIVLRSAATLGVLGARIASVSADLAFHVELSVRSDTEEAETKMKGLEYLGGLRPALPETGTSTGTSVGFFFRAPPWDDQLAVAALVVEPSTRFADAVFVAVRGTWRDAKLDAFLERWNRHLGGTLTKLGITFHGI